MSDGEAKRFYRSRAWRKARAEALRAAGIVGPAAKGVHVHHGKRLDRHPELALVQANLEPISPGLHNSEHAADRRNGAMQGCDASGWPLGQDHPWNKGGS